MDLATMVIAVTVLAIIVAAITVLLRAIGLALLSRYSSASPSTPTLRRSSATDCSSGLPPSPRATTQRCGPIVRLRTKTGYRNRTRSTSNKPSKPSLQRCLPEPKTRNAPVKPTVVALPQRAQPKTPPLIGFASPSNASVRGTKPSTNPPSPSQSHGASATAITSGSSRNSPA